MNDQRAAAPPATKYQYIQMARAIAALVVVFHHGQMVLIRFPEGLFLPFYYFFGTGQYGVHIFFVISGFIISHVVSSASFSLRPYLIKRGLRIYPLYMLCTVVYGLVYLLHRQMPPSKLGYDFEYLIKSMLLMPQWRAPMLDPGWTLEHEVIFYLVMGLGTALFSFRAAVWLLALSAVVGVVREVVLPLFGMIPAVFDYHLTSHLNCYFVLGCALYLTKERWSKKSGPWHLLGGLALLALMAYAKLNHGKAWGHLVMRALELCLLGPGAALLIIGLQWLTDRARLGRSARGLVAALTRLGDISYSVYLVHFIWVAIFQYVHRVYFAAGRWALPAWAADIYFLLFVAASIGSAFVVYHVMERPLIGLAQRLARR
ncbi:acyltransferase family protein [Desulfarculus baarsii]